MAHDRPAPSGPLTRRTRTLAEGLARAVLTGAVSPRRQLIGALLAVVLLGATTAALVSLRGSLSLAGDVLVVQLAVVVVALTGGLWPALAAAVAGTFLLNFFFVPPLHTLRVSTRDDVVALVVFVAVAVLVSAVVDVAERRRRHTELVSARAAVLAEQAARAHSLEAADRLRSALLAAVGHDLRSPLASAKAAVTSLRSDEVAWSPHDEAELLATADESLDRLSRLVGDILDVSRLQAGAMHLTPEAVDLDEVVWAALDGLAAAERVRVDVPSSLPPVLVDAALLERALANLVDNALRFSPAGTRPDVIGTATSAAVVLRVVDAGPGIPPDERDRMFAPFQRLGDRDSSAGIGLGLALSRGLVEAMGGSLQADDTPGGGLTMLVHLPLATAAGPDRTTGPGAGRIDPAQADRSVPA
ncbi:MAG: sensor histidine kinase [Motilibacteraceae bacterium]